jgi:hypothetical protein
MLPIQEIQIVTKNNRVFFMHLEKWSETHFECKLAAINLGPQLPADAKFGPFANGESANSAYKLLISELSSVLATLDATDSIAKVNNPCNTEFVTSEEQKEILGHGVIVKVNGAVA